MKEFSQNAYVNSGKGMQLFPQSDSEDERKANDSDSDYENFTIRGKKKKGLNDKGLVRGMKDADHINIYSSDPNKLELIEILTSMNMLKISAKFDEYPGESVDVD